MKQARDQALEELKTKNLDSVDIDKIKVDVPVAGPSRPVMPAPLPRPWLGARVFPAGPPINPPAPRVLPVAPQPAPIPVLPHYRDAFGGDAFGAVDPYFGAYNLLPLPANFNAYQPLLPQVPLQLPPAIATAPLPIVQPVVAPQPVYARAKNRRRTDYADLGNRTNPYM